MHTRPHRNDCGAPVFAGGDVSAWDAQRWRLAVVAPLVLPVDEKTVWPRGGISDRGLCLTGDLAFARRDGNGWARKLPGWQGARCDQMRTCGPSAEERLASERDREASRRLANSTRVRQEAIHGSSSLRVDIARYRRKQPCRMNITAPVYRSVAVRSTGSLRPSRCVANPVPVLARTGAGERSERGSPDVHAHGQGNVDHEEDSAIRCGRAVSGVSKGAEERERALEVDAGPVRMFLSDSARRMIMAEPEVCGDMAVGGVLNHRLSRAGTVGPTQVAAEAMSIVNRLGRGVIDVEKWADLVEGVVDDSGTMDVD